MRTSLAVFLAFTAIANLTPFAFGNWNPAAILIAQNTGLPEELGSIAQLGVAGALVMVIWLQQREKSEMRKQNDEWENLRHEDSCKLNDTLRDMTRHCADTMRGGRKC